MARLTILHCFQQYLRTTENWAWRLIRNMPECDPIVASHRFLKNVEFYDPALTCLRFPLRRIESDAPLGVPARGFNVLQKAVTRALYPAYVRRALRGRNVDAVHSHFAPVAWQYRGLARSLGAPHVVSFYGWDYEHLPFIEPRWNRRYAELFAGADLFVCEGAHGARLLAQRGCPDHKIVVNRLGTELDRTPVFQRAKRPNELRLLQVATFTAKKGQVHALRAFARAAVQGATLTFVGGGNGVEALQAEARQLGVAERVSFLPPVPFGQLHGLMKDYHVFIQPSCYSDARDCEGGAPVALIDAQGTGMPVISTRHCDIPEVVVDGVTGVLAAEKDVDALAAGIVHFHALGNEAYARYAAAARSHIEDRYDAKKNAASLRQVFGGLHERGT